MAVAVEFPLARDAWVKRTPSRTTSARSDEMTPSRLLPDSILREMLAFFSLEELLVLEDVDVTWRDAIQSSGAWKRVEWRHEQDSDKMERLLRLVAMRHGHETTRLEIINCAVADSVVVECGKSFGQLKQLVVSGCKALSDEGFLSLVSASRDSIVEIRAVRCPMLTDQALVTANGYHARTLEKVDFSHCRFVTSAGVASLVEGASQLHYIGLKGCPKVNDRAIAAVSLHCHGLRTLLLGGSGNISDASLQSIADSCGGLETLDIARSNPFGISRGGVTDTGLNYLISKCNHLQQLVVRGQGQLTPASLVFLPTHCPHLQTLDIGGCRGIVQDPVVLCALLKRVSGLEQLSVSFLGGMVEDHHVSSIASECPKLKKFEVDGETIVASSS